MRKKIINKNFAKDLDDEAQFAFPFSPYLPRYVLYHVEVIDLSSKNIDIYINVTTFL